MRKILISLMLSAVLVGCSAKTESSPQEMSVPVTPQSEFRKISVSEIESEINQSSQNLQRYLDKNRFNLHVLRKRIEDINLPKEEIEQALAVRTVAQMKSDFYDIALSAINTHTAEEFLDLEDTNKICKDGYLRVYERSQFTYVIVQGNISACQQAFVKSQKEIQKIKSQIKLLRADKFQVYITAFKIIDSLNSLLMQIRLSIIYGNTQKTVYLAFPLAFQARLSVIKEANSQLNKVSYITDSIESLTSVNFAEKVAVIDQIHENLELIQVIQQGKITTGAKEIISAQQQYMLALQEVFNNYNY